MQHPKKVINTNSNNKCNLEADSKKRLKGKSMENVPISVITVSEFIAAGSWELRF